jgi:hypothetical protein
MNPVYELSKFHSNVYKLFPSCPLHILQATRIDEEGRYDEAVVVYMEACDTFMTCINMESDDKKKALLQLKVNEFSHRAAVLRAHTEKVRYKGFTVRE